MKDESEEAVFTAGAEDAGVRLDAWLAAQCADSGLPVSRSRIKSLILEGAVSIDDEECNDPSQKIKPGMVAAVLLPPEEGPPAPENIPLDIAYEDEHLLVIRKPAGLVVHPAPGHARGTLVNALLHHCGDHLSKVGGACRPGIVHRLDKDTSGLMLAAKSDDAHKDLARQLADRSLSRRYAALVWGVPQPRKGTVEAPVGRHPANRQKMAVNLKHGRPAVTHYLVEEAFGSTASFLDCRLESGRTHQVRVHMAHRGHPLAGDPVYGLQTTGIRSLLKKSGCAQETADAIMAFPRQALHAKEIAFIHPATGAAMSFTSPLPADLEGLKNLFRTIT